MLSCLSPVVSVCVLLVTTEHNATLVSISIACVDCKTRYAKYQPLADMRQCECLRRHFNYCLMAMTFVVDSTARCYCARWPSKAQLWHYGLVVTFATRFVHLLYHYLPDKIATSCCILFYFFSLLLLFRTPSQMLWQPAFKVPTRWSGFKS